MDSVGSSGSPQARPPRAVKRGSALFRFILLLSVAGSVRAAEPVITRQEAVLLDSVAGIASTNLQRAITVLEAEDPGRTGPALDFALGNLYFQAERLAAASEAYERAVKKMPDFRAAMMNLGRVYLLQERAAESLAIYRRIVDAGDARCECFLLLGHALLLDKHVVSAESAYRQALLYEPDSREAMFGVARCLFEQERHREAAAILKQLLDRYPRDAQLWGLRANVLLSLDKPHEAIVALECARRMGCINAGELATLGDLYMSVGQPVEATARYGEAFGGDSAPPVHRLLRAARGLLDLGEPVQAGKLLAKAEELGQTDQGLLAGEAGARLLSLQAEALQQQGDLQAAMSLYARALSRDPLDGRTMLLLGDLRREECRVEDALMIYERAARVPGFEADALVRQAQLEVEREHYKRAVVLLESAQSFNRQEHVARYLGQLREMLR